MRSWVWRTFQSCVDLFGDLLHFIHELVTLILCLWVVSEIVCSIHELVYLAWITGGTSCILQYNPVIYRPYSAKNWSVRGSLIVLNIVVIDDLSQIREGESIWMPLLPERDTSNQLGLSLCCTYNIMPSSASGPQHSYLSWLWTGEHPMLVCIS